MTASTRPRIPITARAVIGVYLYRLAAAFVVGYPVARALGALGAASLPDGDLGLFQPGGALLLEALRVGARTLSASVQSASVASLLLGVVGLVPLSVALADMEAPRSTRSERWAVAADRAPTLLFLSGATLLMQAAIALGTRVLTGLASALTNTWPNERSADLVTVGAFAVGLVVILAIGVVQDVARADVIRRGSHGFESARAALMVMRDAPREIFFGFVGPWLGSALVVGAALTLTGRLDVSRPGAWRVAGVFLVHQAAAVAIVALRLRALGVALALTPSPASRDAEERDLETAPVRG